MRSATRRAWRSRRSAAAGWNAVPGPIRGAAATRSSRWNGTRRWTALAAELKRVNAAHGADAVFGGSYGWSSAGRFHHAQSQMHRFLNVAQGCCGQLTVVQVEKFSGNLPPIQCFDPPVGIGK